ncbi:uncharacterized protein LOC116606252 [Nematostella vectensis]|uniref:uncharacterized protein LOC116606252 n=1 Tax=Nematostella vectensis TaxID=45351 RepID=UPI00207789E5|nr:uncharacterized protein LOC116606252 [Nematostella vectensis]
MRQDLMATKEAQKNWRSILQKQVKVRKEKKNWEIEEKLPTVQEISALLTSDHADSLKSDLPPNYIQDVAVARNIRDYLMFRVNIENGTRAGVISEITVNEFAAARSGDDDVLQVPVFKHKTATRGHGAMFLTFTQELYKLISLYVRKARPLLATLNQEHLFTTDCGQKVLQPNKNLKAFARRCALLTDGQVDLLTSTMLRKVSFN